MNYEVFPARRHGKAAAVPYVTITKAGCLLLNMAAVELLNHAPFVLLAWDRQAQRIGLRAVGYDRDGFRLQYTATPCRISAGTFLKAIGVSLPVVSRKCVAQWNEVEQMLT